MDIRDFAMELLLPQGQERHRDRRQHGARPGLRPGAGQGRRQRHRPEHHRRRRRHRGADRGARASATSSSRPISPRRARPERSSPPASSGSARVDILVNSAGICPLAEVLDFGRAAVGRDGRRQPDGRLRDELRGGQAHGPAAQRQDHQHLLGLLVSSAASGRRPTRPPSTASPASPRPTATSSPSTTSRSTASPRATTRPRSPRRPAATP